MEDCIVYLVFQLRQTGFEVRFTYPNLLWISWKHHEADYLTKQNPIIQAMVIEQRVPEQQKPPAPLAKPQAMSKKKQLPPAPAAHPQANTNTNRQVSFEDEIALLTGMAPSSARQEPQDGSMTPYFGGTRRAADYQPPSSFMNTMDRPQKQGGAKGNVLADLWAI